MSGMISALTPSKSAHRLCSLSLLLPHCLPLHFLSCPLMFMMGQLATSFLCSPSLRACYRSLFTSTSLEFQVELPSPSVGDVKGVGLARTVTLEALLDLSSEPLGDNFEFGSLESIRTSFSNDASLFKRVSVLSSECILKLSH